jgi:hypothetical protein
MLIIYEVCHVFSSYLFLLEQICFVCCSKILLRYYYWMICMLLKLLTEVKTKWYGLFQKSHGVRVNTRL